MGGRLNNAAFLGGSSYDEAADYGDDVARCTVDVSGSEIKSLYRTVPGTALSLPFLLHNRMHNRCQDVAVIMKWIWPNGCGSVVKRT